MITDQELDLLKIEASLGPPDCLEEKAYLEIVRLRKEETVNAGRLRRLRNALLAAGVHRELVDAIEWDNPA